MLDPSIPLTTNDYDEWGKWTAPSIITFNVTWIGNPALKEIFNYIKDYSPYDNIRIAAYPAIYVTTGINDPRVAYWEPVKYVAKVWNISFRMHGFYFVLFLTNFFFWTAKSSENGHKPTTDENRVWSRPLWSFWALRSFERDCWNVCMGIIPSWHNKVKIQTL